MTFYLILLVIILLIAKLIWNLKSIVTIVNTVRHYCIKRLLPILQDAYSKNKLLHERNILRLSTSISSSFCQWDYLLWTFIETNNIMELDRKWHDMKWYDMIWYDMIWYVIIWYVMSYVMSWHMTWHMTSHNMTWYHITSHHITSHHITWNTPQYYLLTLTLYYYLLKSFSKNTACDMTRFISYK